MDKFGRFYTETVFSDLLVRTIGQDNPKTVIDLGIGTGSLSKSALERWINARYYGADIDKISIAKINNEFPLIKIARRSGLSLEIHNELGIEKGSIDVAICNPPYLKIKNKERFSRLLCSANLGECLRLKQITSDILFLAQNLRLLRPHGELGIILPDSLISGHEFELFRSSLLNNHKVKCIIQLPDQVFLKTEARTHILFVEKSGESDNIVPIFKTNSKGICDDQITVNKSELVHSMAFEYHAWKHKYSQRDTIALSQILIDLSRGSLTHAELQRTRQPYFHTTNFRMKSPCNQDRQIGAKHKRFNSARAGDILLARVGKRCVGKTFYVRKGEFLISDCVYRIRVSARHRLAVFNALNSEWGKHWIKSVSHGVCSQVISMSDLHSFPLPNSDFGLEI